MCASVAIARTTSTIKINDNNSDNYMRQSKSVHNHNNDLFTSVNVSTNWRKKLSTPNYQDRIDKNQVWTILNRQSSLHHGTSTNWINIRWTRAKRASRRSLPIPSTHSHTKHNRTNLNVHFEWNSRYSFSVSPEIYSR